VIAEPFLALAVVLVIALAYWVIARPDALTLIVLFLFYTNAVGVAVKVHGAPVALALVLIFLLVVPLARQLARGEKFVVTPALPLLLLLLAAQIVSTLFATDIDRSWVDLQGFIVEGALLYVLVTNVIRSPEVLRRCLWMVILAGALLGGLSLFQDVTGTYARPYGGFAQVPGEFFSGHSDKPRLAGPLGDPNYYAQILLVAVPLALFMIWNERRALLRALAFGAGALAIAGILLTFSRGAGLAFLVVFVIMAGLRAIRPRYVVLVVAGLAVALSAVPAYKDRISTVTAVGGATAASGGDSAADASMRSRMTEMLAAAKVFADHPVVGVGPANFPLYYQDYAERIGIELRDRVRFGPRRGEEPQRESHNMFLSIAAEQGIIGLILFCAVIVVTQRELLRARRRFLRTRPDLVNMATSLFLAIIAYVIAGMFLTLAYERYFWLLLALGGAAASVLLREPVPEAAPLRAARRRAPPAVRPARAPVGAAR
jgi:O-antigen ligase